MWSGFRNKKNNEYDNGTEEELNPMLSNNSQSDTFFSEYENKTTTAQTGMVNTVPIPCASAKIPTLTHPRQSTIVQGIDINIDSIDEFTKITNEIYVCNCSDISVDFLQSVGFNCIVNVSSEKNSLPNVTTANNCTKYMNITLENIEKKSTHIALDKFITTGLQKPKVILNFMDAKIMVITVLYYLITHKLSGSDFVHAYNPKALPNQYLHMLYKLIPELDKYRTNENFMILVDMFPDMPRNKLEQLYKDSGEDLEYVISMIFS